MKILNPHKVRRDVQTILVFLCTALLMFAFESLKESIFRSSLSPWESHSITIVVTAILATFASLILRKSALAMYEEYRDKQEEVRMLVERDRAVDTLRASEKRFRQLASSTFEGIAIIEQDRIVDTNEQLASILRAALPTLRRGERLFSARIFFLSFSTCDVLAPGNERLDARMPNAFCGQATRR